MTSADREDPGGRHHVPNRHFRVFDRADFCTCARRLDSVQPISGVRGAVRQRKDSICTGPLCCRGRAAHGLHCGVQRMGPCRVRKRTVPLDMVELAAVSRVNRVMPDGGVVHRKAEVDPEKTCVSMSSDRYWRPLGAPITLKVTCKVRYGIYPPRSNPPQPLCSTCLLYTSDAADE